MKEKKCVCLEMFLNIRKIIINEDYEADSMTILIFTDYYKYRRKFALVSVLSQHTFIK